MLVVILIFLIALLLELDLDNILTLVGEFGVNVIP